MGTTEINKSQLESINDAKSFLIDKLGCGPEVRAILDHIHQLEQHIEWLELELQIKERN